MDLNAKPPFSKGDMKRAGNALKEGAGLDAKKYAEIVTWHKGLIRETCNVCDEVLDRYRRDLDSGNHLFAIEGEIVRGGRTKSGDTLVDKLRRINLSLDAVQDFAGTRYDIPCGITAQKEIASRMADTFKTLGAQVEIKNYLNETQQGYRAIHLWLRMPAGRVEIQIRTALQARWANLNELLGDKVGRGIRYTEPTKAEYGEYLPLITRVRYYAEVIRSLEQRRDALLRDLSSDADIAAELLDRGLRHSHEEEDELVALMRKDHEELYYLEGRKND